MITTAPDTVVADLVGRLDGAESFVEVMSAWCGGGLLVQLTRLAEDRDDDPPLQKRTVTMHVTPGRQVAAADSTVALNHLTPAAREALASPASVLGVVLRTLGHRRRTLSIRRLASGPVTPETAVIEVHAQMVTATGAVSARIIETVFGAAFLQPPNRQQPESPTSWWAGS